MRLTRAAIGFLSLGTAVLVPAQAQQYVVSTYAGVPKQPGVNLSTFGLGIATDASGNVYFTSDSNCICVFKLDQNGVVTRIAGKSQPGYSGETSLSPVEYRARLSRVGRAQARPYFPPLVLRCTSGRASRWRLPNKFGADKSMMGEDKTS